MDPWTSFWDKLGNWFTGQGWKSSNGMSDDINDANAASGNDDGKWFSGSASSAGEFLNDATGVSATQQFNAEEAEKQRTWEDMQRQYAEMFNSAEAEKARQFQYDMDSTAITRRMADMQMAGINPMAIASGSNLMSGASSGSTAASISTGSGSAASNSGNSAAAVGGIIRALATLVRVAK